MPVPTTYSEAIFADYLASQIADVADVLGWDAGSVQVQEAVTDALLDLGVSTIGDATDIRGLRALGRRAIWRAVVQATAAWYSVTDNGQKLERQQVNTQAHSMLEQAVTDCHGLGVDRAYVASIVRISRPNDPYVVLPDEQRAL